jgi:DNA-binding transcriptional ArsR family regulator
MLVNMDVTTFTALAEQNRFNIVELLRGGPRPVGDIAKLLRLHQPQTSKHLRVLADAGIVEARPLAQRRIYQLRPQTFTELDKWVDSYREVLESRLDRLDKYLKEEQRKEKKHGRRKH